MIEGKGSVQQSCNGNSQTPSQNDMAKVLLSFSFLFSQSLSSCNFMTSQNMGQDPDLCLDSVHENWSYLGVEQIISSPSSSSCTLTDLVRMSITISLPIWLIPIRSCHTTFFGMGIMLDDIPDTTEPRLGDLQKKRQRKGMNGRN